MNVQVLEFIVADDPSQRLVFESPLHGLPSSGLDWNVIQKSPTDGSSFTATLYYVIARQV